MLVISYLHFLYNIVCVVCSEQVEGLIIAINAVSFFRLPKTDTIHSLNKGRLLWLVY